MNKAVSLYHLYPVCYEWIRFPTSIHLILYHEELFVCIHFILLCLRRLGVCEDIVVR